MSSSDAVASSSNHRRPRTRIADVPIKDIWQSELAKWVFENLKKNWTALKRPDAKHLEFEVRLGRVVPSGQFNSGVSEQVWAKYYKFLQGAVRAKVFKASSKTTVDVKFDADLRLTLEYDPMARPQYNTIRAERKKKNSANRGTFRTSVSSPSLLYDLRLGISSEEPVNLTDPEVHRQSNLAKSVLNNFEPLNAVDTGCEVFLTKPECPVRLETSERTLRKRKRQTGAVPEAEDTQDDIVVKSAGADGILPFGIAKKIRWHVAHIQALSLSSFRVPIYGTKSGILGERSCRLVSGPGRIDGHVYSAGQYSVVVDRTSIYPKGGNVVYARGRQSDDARDEIRHFRRKVRSTFKHAKMPWQYDLTVTQSGATFEEMVRSPKVYEIEFEVASFAMFNDPKVATFWIMREVVDSVLLRHKCTVRGNEHFLGYQKPSNDGLYMRRQ